MTFAITPRQMSLIDERGKRVIEPGEFLIRVGSEAAMSGRFTVSGKAYEILSIVNRSTK